jgi:MoxR-like ATPase
MNRLIDNLVQQANQVILGKETQIRLAIACLLANGHLLIEDLPGMGKTTLAHMLASLMGMQFNRVQFTSDLLPSDITGVTIYDKENSSFTFHPGPIFTQVVLADEINRATPRTQSALLEAMEERQVSIEGETRPLPEPFFVIATQNPTHHIGTFPLPESQYDRFLMRIELGFPGRDAERKILKSKDRRILLHELQPCIAPQQVLKIQGLVPEIYASDALLDYIQDLVDYTRSQPVFGNGLSPRASLAMLRSAQAWAFMQGRDAVIPEDIQAILPSVAGHRLRGSQETHHQNISILVGQLQKAVPIP